MCVCTSVGCCNGSKFVYGGNFRQPSCLARMCMWVCTTVGCCCCSGPRFVYGGEFERLLVWRARVCVYAHLLAAAAAAAAAAAHAAAAPGLCMAVSLWFVIICRVGTNHVGADTCYF